MVSLAMSAFICRNASVQAGVHSMGLFFAGPLLFNSVGGANISLHFGHKSRWYFTMPRGTASPAFILGEFKIDNCFNFFWVQFDTLLRNNLSQVVNFGYCRLALINITFYPIGLELLHNLLDLG